MTNSPTGSQTELGTIPAPAADAERVPAARREVFGLPVGELAKSLEPVIDQPYRVGQVYRALYQRGLADFAEMTELSKALRAQLGQRFAITLPEISQRHLSADGTVKYLFQLADGATIETVDIPDARRRTLCLSSQAGCALACRFCVTGYWGAGRNLSAGEIVGQLLLAQRQPSSPVEGLNLVFMGMGEPLLNLEALGQALEIITDLISWRRITLSTAGVIPGIEALARWPRRPRLAISLHAPDDERRSRIMPINQRYPLADLLAALRRFPLAKRERLTFEYILIRNFNDALQDADALARLLTQLPAKVNLIPLNPDPVLDPEMKAPQRQQVEAFQRRLKGHGVTTTVRKQRGDDVSAACGQLRAPDRTPRGFRRSNLSL
ncbi:MAG: 23S rRNA (adenine(2503)-C(2))-methyltransferase RlmN [Acidobacteriota bacterium]